MKTHELAKLLLTLPDLPVATSACGHQYMTRLMSQSHGPLKVGLLKTYGGDHIVIGNILEMNMNRPNWFVSEMLHGTAPWRGWRTGESLDAGKPENNAEEIKCAVEENAKHLADTAAYLKRCEETGERPTWTL